MASLTAKNERTNKALAVFITLLIHAGLLLFLLYYIIVTPIPPYPEVPTPELEVDFAGGGGGGSSAAMTAINKTSRTEEEHNKVTTVVSNQPTVNSEAEPSTPISSEKATKPTKKVDTVPKPQEPSVELVSLENKFKSAKANGGGGSGQGGNGSGIGSGQGSGSGTGSGSGSGSGNGRGNGSGIGDYDLKGRSILRRPELSYNTPEQGKIVVGITVDQDGNVIEATPGMVGSTITDASLYILVKNAAMKIKFTKSPDDSPEQSGTVTFRFTIQ